MPYRSNLLVTNNIYHVFSKSIAGFKIFNSEYEFDRMVKTIAYYRSENLPCKLSLVLRPKDKKLEERCFSSYDSERIVEVLAYCLMPTHIHLILKQVGDNGISRYINLILKSYSKYFNTKYKRKGPLWEGRFKHVCIDTDEQFLHLTRYIHLNPVSAHLIDRPEDWKFSSYREYIAPIETTNKMCEYSSCFDMNLSSYKNFVENHIDYQRELARLKHLVIE